MVFFYSSTSSSCVFVLVNSFLLTNDFIRSYKISKEFVPVFLDHVWRSASILLEVTKTFHGLPNGKKLLAVFRCLTPLKGLLFWGSRDLIVLRLPQILRGSRILRNYFLFIVIDRLRAFGNSVKSSSGREFWKVRSD